MNYKLKDLTELSGNSISTLHFLLWCANNGQQEMIQQLETLGLRGTAIYIFWNDLSKRDPARAKRILEAVPAEVLLKASGVEDYSGLRMIEPFLQTQKAS